ncbi:MAG: hypothetical protein KHX03_09815 [Clostridium sp.]|nr:hypothetical protein [Clostridium sp.]
MKVYKPHPQKLLEWVKNHVYFTHNDILRITKCNCPYSVLRALRRQAKISEESKTKKEKLVDSKGNVVNVTTRYTLYKFEGLKNAVNG